MTGQVPVKFMFDGRLWSVVDWNDGYPDVPTNEQLGFRTVVRSSANWSGRVDQFLVFGDQLYLFKIDANLSDENRELVPFGARKEVRLIYEPVESHGQTGLRMTHRANRQDIFVFDDLLISFSGQVTLEHPVWDPWECPWPLDESKLEPTHQATLDFTAGKLVYAHIRELLEGGAER